VGVMSKIIPPSPYPSPPRGEGRPFIPPAELGGILAHFYKGVWGNMAVRLKLLQNVNYNG